MNIRTALAQLHQCSLRLEARQDYKLAARVHQMFVRLAEEFYDSSRDRFPKYEYDPREYAKDITMGDESLTPEDRPEGRYSSARIFIFPSRGKWWMEASDYNDHDLREINNTNIMPLNLSSDIPGAIAAQLVRELTGGETTIRVLGSFEELQSLKEKEGRAFPT